MIKCAKYLNDLGVILYFHNDKNLEDMVILEPRWLTKVMASLFTTKHNYAKNGLLKEADLGQIWKEYPAEIHPRLMALLETFEIIHRVGAIDSSLISALFAGYVFFLLAFVTPFTSNSQIFTLLQSSTSTFSFCTGH